MAVSVVIAAGGTGGHLIPALAIARALEMLAADVRVSFVGTARALDRELLRSYRSHATAVRPFSRDVRGIFAGVSLVPATWQARAILTEEKASVAVGMGGYASIPVIAAARLARVPSLVHEANAVPGLANELAARMTPNIAVSFPEAARAFRSRSPRLIGMPLRAPVATFDRASVREEALRELKLQPSRRTVLVFGGSQGATRINAAALDLAERWRARTDVQLLVIAGRSNADEVAARAPEDVRVLPFLDRMELAYAAADVAVCRAGASTLAELAATGLPAILVPYPHARRREQDANASSYARSGAAIVVDDASLDGAVLASMLERSLGDREQLLAMAAAARASARPRAAEDMARWILEIAGA